MENQEGKPPVGKPVARRSRGEKLADVAKARSLSDAKLAASARRVPALPRKELPPVPLPGESMTVFQSKQKEAARELSAAYPATATAVDPEHLAGLCVCQAVCLLAGWLSVCLSFFLSV